MSHRPRREDQQLPYESEMPDPDWDRYVMPHQQPGAHLPPVGDPTRWGASLQTLIPATGLQSSTQILAATTRDAYSRSWSLIGTLSLPIAIYGGGVSISVALEITQGVGQAQITQRIVLYSGGLTPVGSGLIVTQYYPNGGVYEGIVSASPLTGAPYYTKSFAAIGALVGQSINIRAAYTCAALPGLPDVSDITLLLAPYAAGDKL